MLYRTQANADERTVLYLKTSQQRSTPVRPRIRKYWMVCRVRCSMETFSWVGKNANQNERIAPQKERRSSANASERKVTQGNAQIQIRYRSDQIRKKKLAAWRKKRPDRRR